MKTTTRIAPLLIASLAACALPLEDGTDAAAPDDVGWADDGAEAGVDGTRGSAFAWGPPPEDPKLGGEAIACLRTSANGPACIPAVTRCGSSTYCAPPDVTTHKACMLSARTRYADLMDPSYVIDCVPRPYFYPDAGAGFEVELFELHIADVDMPIVAVITEPDGRRFVTEVFNTVASAAGGEETAEHVSVYARREGGLLRVDASMRSQGEWWSCTEHDISWKGDYHLANYCTETGSGELSCTGRVPLRVVDWELHHDDDGVETRRSTTAAFGLRVDWRGSDVFVSRRSGRLSSSYQKALGLHSVGEVRELLRNARFGPF